MAEKAFRTVLELRAGSLDASDVVVEELTGREALSEAYAFDLAFRPVGADPIDLDALLGQEALLSLRRPDGDGRLINGILALVELTGMSSGKPRYRARLVPRFALLEHTCDSRIFQKKSVPDIVKEVLDADKVRFRLALSGSYSKREYCVQYQESDSAFLSRLLEAEGIFYFFEHDEDHHTMVFADAPSACHPMPGDATLAFRDAQVARDQQAAEHIFALQWVHRERPSKSTLRDYDFLRPELDLTASSAVSEGQELEVYRYPGGYSLPAAGKRLAKVRLEELRATAEGFSGESTCLRLAPGSTFDVVEHPDDAFNTSLVGVVVEHRARQEFRAGSEAVTEGSYANRFIGVAAQAPLRPPLRTPCPHLRGTQTAMVVGPTGEEIYTDEHGRIMVQFHWDRQGKKDEHAGCFIRAAQDWAGAGFGQLVLPRIGQEVVVRFLEGDPDRPVVVGAVFNGANAPPLDLPAERALSTLRSDSSVGGGGCNEFRYDDSKGDEQVYRHAQRNERIVVEHDKQHRVGAVETLAVTHDRSRQIQGSQTLKVALDDAIAVSGNEALSVTGNRITSIGGDSAESVGTVETTTVAGALMDVVGASSSVDVGGAASLTVGGAYAVNVGGLAATSVGASLTRQVAGTSTEVVGAVRNEAVTGNASDAMAADFAEQVDGQVAVVVTGTSEETVTGNVAVSITDVLDFSGKQLDLEADKLTIIVNGQVLWQMDGSSGAVTIGANNFTLKASNNLTLKGSNVNKVASDSAAQQNLTLKALDDLHKARASVKVTAKDANGVPMANVRFKAELPDGSIHEGATDAQGGASIPSGKPGKVKISFPDLHHDAWKNS